MKLSKRRLFYFLILLAFSLFISTFQLPYYIYKPGGADELASIVEVDDGFVSEGDMHLVTVSGGQATPIQYVFAKVFPHHEILPLEQVLPEGMTDEEYMHAQLQMMESSQQASIVVAYQAANKEIKIDYQGVYVVSVVEGMPADSKLQPGDRITGIDGQTVKEADDLIDYISDKQAGDIVSLAIDREKETITEDLVLDTFEKGNDKIGVGIELVTDRNVEVNPHVDFSSGSIGGPSAGLMFSLEIYDQLTKEDLTKGYQIIGTGEVDYNGKVDRIGGIDKKVVAAERAGCDVFFAPYENGAKNSNYEVAKQTAEEINAEMEIVPVDNFDEALTYLQDMSPKS